MGDIEAREVGPRSSVWSERHILDAAAKEFVETERFLEIAEELVGPYLWERYDILLMPPSFPYGGMENPCLTFASPSIVTGDKSAVNVIIHEISHSWTGNLVSCENWEHFWLNEGFTMFLQRKIWGRLKGEEHRQLDSHIGLTYLKESLEQLENGPLTALVPDLTETDPDDAFSHVPYEKGYLFLYLLEDAVGGPTIFEPFFKAHIQNFADQSITSEQFKDFTFQYFSDNPEVSLRLAQFDWDFKSPGMCKVIPTYDDSLILPCRGLADEWLNYGEERTEVYSQLSPDQKVMFFEFLLASEKVLSMITMTNIGDSYQMGDVVNSEILLKWYQLVIKTKSTIYYPAAAKFASERGRMKYCRPILRGLYQLGGHAQQLAVETFTEFKEQYHPIAQAQIAKDLGLSS